jgi:hypothetical protein
MASPHLIPVGLAGLAFEHLFRVIFGKPRVPVHWGFGWSNYRSKRFGLITWPVAGAVSYLLLGVFSAALSHGHREDLAAIVLMIVIMGMMAALQADALAAARRTVGGGAMGPEQGV